MKSGSKLWRVGNSLNPLEFLPSNACSWSNKFDDPLHDFRTLYCAKHQVTALRESLVVFRPSITMLRDFRKAFGGEMVSGAVTRKWRQSMVLASGVLDIRSGDLLPLIDIGVRRFLESELGEFLESLRINYLDIDVISGRNRLLTQAIARAIYERGGAGVIYPSRLDGNSLVALFEGRARLLPTGEAASLDAELPDLDMVLKEYGLNPSL